MRVTMIDNYDSFTYNLVQYLQHLGHIVSTYRNDEIQACQVIDEKPDFIVLSPGPSHPENAGICIELVQLGFGNHLPIFGVCLGHQAIAQAFGAKVIEIDPPVHGKTSPVYHKKLGVFDGLPNPLEATRYHSLVVEQGSLDPQLQVTGELETGMIMGIKHMGCLIEGVQFHPESVLTKYGMQLLANFASQVEGLKGQLAK
ncbi:MAG: aminodeoxychorismate/anthranilate synthase component II [Oligoflexales bacterium]